MLKFIKVQVMAMKNWSESSQKRENQNKKSDLQAFDENIIYCCLYHIIFEIQIFR